MQVAQERSTFFSKDPQVPNKNCEGFAFFLVRTRNLLDLPTSGPNSLVVRHYIELNSLRSMVAGCSSFQEVPDKSCFQTDKRCRCVCMYLGGNLLRKAIFFLDLICNMGMLLILTYRTRWLLSFQKDKVCKTLSKDIYLHTVFCSCLTFRTPLQAEHQLDRPRAGQSSSFTFCF